jgi:uncharacterized RDD family membrane protein YckC
MYCTKCGGVIGETASFCGVCGQPAAGAAPVGTSAPFPGQPVTPAQAIQTNAAAFGAPPAQPYGMVALPSPFAGFWLRLVAHFIDSILIGFACCVAIFVVIVVVGFGTFKGDLENINSPDEFFTATVIVAIVFVALVLMVGTWIYYAGMESSSHQGTLGKIALGLFVTDLQGRRVTFGRASGRFFAKIVSNLVPFCLAYIMAGFTDKKQALHDMIAGCLVLRKN